jgi:integrase
MATRLVHFGRFLAEVDPDLTSLADLGREKHIEPYLNSVTKAIDSKNGEPITTADQARRVLTVSSFLNEITEWGWADAPKRRLVFRSDIPRLPKPLPRYLPVDADRRLGEALTHSEFRLAADALLLARACGLRIGELLDLELDCVHEIPGSGWSPSTTRPSLCSTGLPPPDRRVAPSHTPATDGLPSSSSLTMDAGSPNRLCEPSSIAPLKQLGSVM